METIGDITRSGYPAWVRVLDPDLLVERKRSDDILVSIGESFNSLTRAIQSHAENEEKTCLDDYVRTLEEYSSSLAQAMYNLNSSLGIVDALLTSQDNPALARLLSSYRRYSVIAINSLASTIEYINQFITLVNSYKGLSRIGGALIRILKKTQKKITGETKKCSNNLNQLSECYGAILDSCLENVSGINPDVSEMATQLYEELTRRNSQRRGVMDVLGEVYGFLYSTLFNKSNPSQNPQGNFDDMISKLDKSFQDYMASMQEELQASLDRMKKLVRGKEYAKDV